MLPNELQNHVSVHEIVLNTQINLGKFKYSFPIRKLLDFLQNYLSVHGIATTIQINLGKF